MTEENEIDNTYARIYTRGDHVTGVFKNIDMNIKAAKRIAEERKKISRYNTTIILVDARSTEKLTKEARNYFGSGKATELLHVTVILVNSVLNSFLTNFIINVNFKKAAIPTKVFSDLKKGEELL